MKITKQIAQANLNLLKTFMNSFANEAQGTEIAFEVKGALSVLDNALAQSGEEQAEYQPKTPASIRLKNIKKFLEEWIDDDAASATSAEVDLLAELLGFRELVEFPDVFDKDDEDNIKAQIQELYSLNNSMITADPNHIPRYTDGTIIKPSDLADMNMNALDNIAELIGFELEE
ncbi:hypothetical protein [Lactococcus allomyrinae]|uniref:Uncharacterized protein n=1 Tax=Lactococcus allomyrinae TaxID=2419773 RepID=A0A387BC58_9LACT|nr:hypothetical protein [Lactococcus allomyrinae]AYG01455.1 hypothetical protein D7I46_10485 [Lactococcus allomyrinae]